MVHNFACIRSSGYRITKFNLTKNINRMRKLKKMCKRLLKLLKLFKPRQPHLPQTNVRCSVSHCEKCGSKNVDNTYSRYTRGYNELCQQACGDIGAFCNDCCYVTFVQSLKDYKKSLPHWCWAYEY